MPKWRIHECRSIYSINDTCINSIHLSHKNSMPQCSATKSALSSNEGLQKRRIGRAPSARRSPIAQSSCDGRPQGCDALGSSAKRRRYGWTNFPSQSQTGDDWGRIVLTLDDREWVSHAQQRSKLLLPAIWEVLYTCTAAIGYHALHLYSCCWRFTGVVCLVCYCTLHESSRSLPI